MTHFQILALYVALHLVLTFVLIMRVGQVRISSKIYLGDSKDGGQDEVLFARIRAHANYTENTPLALIGLFTMAMLSAPPLALHIFGAGYFIARILHAHGMAQPKSTGKTRMIGMSLTLLTFLGTAATLLVLIFTQGAH